MWRLLHNKWIVFGGLAMIAVSMVFGTYLATTSAGQATQRASDVRLFETATPQPTATATPDPNATPAPTPSPTVTPPQRRFSTAPPVQIDPEKQYFATVRTEKGDFRIQLAAKEAPQAVNHFVFLAKSRYYDGLTFHRVLPGFVAQGGDAGFGTPGYGIPVENNSLRHETGSVAIARNNTTGELSGQFYVSLQPQPSQDGKDTVIGKVVSGLDVLQRLTERNPERNPSAPPGDKIVSITIEEGPVS